MVNHEFFGTLFFDKSKCCSFSKLGDETWGAALKNTRKRFVLVWKKIRPRKKPMPGAEWAAAVLEAPRH